MEDGDGAEAGQFVFQGGAELLMGVQTPAVAHRTAPMSVSGIFSVPHAQGERPEGGAQMHRLAAPMVALRWLWGKNSAVAVGLGLEFLFQPSAHPLRCFLI